MMSRDTLPLHILSIHDLAESFIKHFNLESFLLPIMHIREAFRMKSSTSSSETIDILRMKSYKMAIDYLHHLDSDIDLST